MTNADASRARREAHVLAMATVREALVDSWKGIMDEDDHEGWLASIFLRGFRAAIEEVRRHDCLRRVIDPDGTPATDVSSHPGQSCAEAIAAQLEKML